MKEPIRILNLFTIMNRGGAETMVMNYYRNMDRTKVQFDFMVHRQEKGSYDDEIESLGGKIYRMPPIRPWTASEYRKIIREFYDTHREYKIIHSHMSELGYYDFIESERLGVPVRICHAHSYPREFDFKMIFRTYYKKRMMTHITHMFTCGLESGIWLYGNKNRKFFIQLNNAIDSKKYIYNIETRKTVRAHMGIEKKFVIGHVGRFCAVKNHSFIIDIFSKLHNKHPESVLLLVGQDNCKIGKEIHKKVKSLGLSDAVHFLGVRSDVADIMQAMDVFLFPSLFEGFGIVALEAQAAGLPTLVSERIPNECYITDLIHSQSLHSSPEVWAKRLWQARTLPRTNRYQEIQSKGFDIKENAKKLQQFYLDTYLENV